MNKKLLCGVLSLTLGLALLTGCSSSGKGNDDVIKIGGLGPLTGDAATYGQSIKNGAQLYVDEINNAGGINGKKVELIFEDDQADPNSSTQAFNKLVNNDKVLGLVGPTTSGAALAVAPNATSQKVPMITPSGTEPTITVKGGEYVFRGCFIDSFQGEMLAKYAKESLGKTKAAVLYNSGSDYSKGIADAFKAKFEALGGTITDYSSYNDGDTDFNAQLTSIKSNNPDVLVLPDYYNVVSLIAKQARDNGISAQFLGGDGWESEELATIGGDAVNGALYLNHYYSEDEAEQVQSFVKAYKEKYNAAPDAFAALAYDSTKILLDAIAASGDYSPEKIIEAMKSTDLDNVTGKITFDENRSAVKSATIIKVDGDKKVLVDKVNP
ncbi:MAG: ABC transporter substrate-binding protein [Clostridiales bacterium]|nr:ABC transporter substrate-binding protein [Clostridiales bacterium]